MISTHRSRRKGKTERQSPTRTCVACRSQRKQEELLRVVLDPDNIHIHMDYLGKSPGRGAYVCPTPACLQRAVERGGFSKAFRRSIRADYEVLLLTARNAAVQQMRALLSLANRARRISAGHSRVEQALRDEKACLLLLARDASQGVQRKFQQWAERIEVPTHSTLTKQSIGPCVGYNECALLTIDDPGFAQKFEQEVARSRQLTPT